MEIGAILDSFSDSTQGVMGYFIFRHVLVFHPDRIRVLGQRYRQKRGTGHGQDMVM